MAVLERKSNPNPLQNSLASVLVSRRSGEKTYNEERSKLSYLVTGATGFVGASVGDIGAAPGDEPLFEHAAKIARTANPPSIIVVSFIEPLNLKAFNRVSNLSKNRQKA